MRSAAELLGAQANILASGFWRSNCRILSMIVTVLPVPGLEGGSDGDSCYQSAKHLRAKNTERGRARRKSQDRRNSLELCPVVCDVRVVNHPPHPENARTSDRTKVSHGGKQDSVLLKHSIHRLMLSANRVPVQPKSNGKPLFGARHSERSVKA